MSNILGIWHLVLEGSQEQVFRAPAVVQITNVAFGEVITDADSRSVVKLTFATLTPDDEDEEANEGLSSATTVLCALTPGKVEHSTLNITLSSDDEYRLLNTGKNTVYLTGHYLDTGSLDSDSEIYSDDEGAYDLRDVSSDVEMHPDDLDGLESDGARFEEVKEQKEQIKPTKRSRESDPIASGEADKADKKKKLKANDGQAVLAETTAGDEKDKKKKKDKKDKKKQDDSKTDPTEGTTKTQNGIVIKDHTIGTGPLAKAGDTVSMRYIGKLENGTEFDKNVSGKPFTFHLGKGEVIKGWDEGIVGMQVGGERVLKIPPSLAYGKKAQKGIPANSALNFEVKLLKIK